MRNATDSFTPYWKNAARLSGAVFVWLAVLFFASAQASELAVKSANLTPTNQGYAMNADFNVNLNHTLEEALERGVVLFFVIESHIWRPRWWWFNDTIASAQETRKLSYNALTRQYRLSEGDRYQNFSSLEDAESALASLRNQVMMGADAFDKEKSYRASVRIWLDVTQLPKPFQVKAVTAADWKLDSNEWVFDVVLR